MGAPIGNDNPARGKAFAGALRRVLHGAGTDREKLIEIADALVNKAIEGDLPAIREVADRLDGKAAQAIEHSGPEGGEIKAKVTVEFIAAAGGVPLPVVAQS